MRETRNVFSKSRLNILRKKKPFCVCTFFSFIFEGHPYQASLWCAPLQASPLIATHSPFKKQEGDGDVQEGVETLPVSTKNVFSYIKEYFFPQNDLLHYVMN